MAKRVFAILQQAMKNPQRFPERSRPSDLAVLFAYTYHEPNLAAQAYWAREEYMAMFANVPMLQQVMRKKGYTVSVRLAYMESWPVMTRPPQM